MGCRDAFLIRLTFAEPIRRPPAAMSVRHFVEGDTLSHRNMRDRVARCRRLSEAILTPAAHDPRVKAEGRQPMAIGVATRLECRRSQPKYPSSVELV